jgi:uncharacterized protein (UPF0333 family)
MVIVLLLHVYIVIVLYSLMRDFEEEKSVASTTNAAPTPTISVIPAEPAATTDNQNVVYDPRLMIDPFSYSSAPAFSSAPPPYKKV